MTEAFNLGYVAYADLDGHLLIANDPYSGVKVVNGRLVLPRGPIDVTFDALFSVVYPHEWQEETCESDTGPVTSRSDASGCVV